MSLLLADPFLRLAADVLDDLETVHTANANRLRQLTRDEPDEDGLIRGFGLPDNHPDVVRLAALVDALDASTKKATSNLESLMKRHPLGPWVQAQRGVGLKTGARLLAAIGDPYWHDAEDRPRLVSELWSYSGYGDAAAQVRRRGHKANWSAEAKMRTFLIAESCVKTLRKPCHTITDDKGAYLSAVHVDDCACGTYRRVYDDARAKYAGSTHPRECDRCTGKGQPPAHIGSPRKAAHIQAIAYRAVSKRILRDLWCEARRLHELHDG